MPKTLAERLRDCAQGVSLGADGMGWSPDLALLEEAADKIVSLHAELQKARDGLTKGRTSMREDVTRLQAEVEQLRANNAALAREAHTWWTAARDAEKRAQRVPLDPLDIEEMWDEVTAMDVDDWHQEFARRIERQHGIGA